MTVGEPERRDSEDPEELEVWGRDEDSPWDVVAVCLDREDWPWSVFVAAAEFVREEPLESELVAAVEEALSGVVGVQDVAHEDREVWVLSGVPTGRDLVAAVGAAVDGLADRIQPLLE